jgi:hypothetical protein
MKTGTRVINEMSAIVQLGDTFLIPDACTGFGQNGKHRPWVVVALKGGVATISPRTTKTEWDSTGGCLHPAQLHNGFSKDGKILKKHRRTVRVRHLFNFKYIGQVERQPRVPSKEEVRATLEDCIPEIAGGKVEVTRISIDPIDRNCKVLVTAKERGIDSVYACRGCRDLRRKDMLEQVRGISQIEFFRVGDKNYASRS